MAVYNNFKLSFPSEEQAFIMALINQCYTEGINTFTQFANLSVEETEEIINDLSSSGDPFYGLLGEYLFNKAAAISTGDNQEKWNAYKASFPDDYEPAVQSLIDVLRAAPNNLTFDTYKTKSGSYVAGIIYANISTPNWLFFYQFAFALQLRASKLFDGWQALHNTYSGEEQQAMAELLDYFQITEDKPDYAEFLELQAKGMADSLVDVYADSLYIQNIAKTFRTRLNELVSNYTPSDALEQALIDSYRNEMREGIRQLITSLKSSGIIMHISDLLSIPLAAGSVSFTSVQTASVSLPQKTGIVISGTPAVGQTYVIEMNNKDVVYFKATAATVANVTAGLTAAINAVTSGEWDSVTATDEGASDNRVVVTHNSDNITFSLSILNNNYFPFLQAFIATLPSTHPLYYSLGSSLYTDAIPFREAGKITRVVKGRVVKLDGLANDIPLANYKVQLLDIDDSENPIELGVVSTNAQGYFSLNYTLPNQVVTEKNIRVKVLGTDDLETKIIFEDSANLFTNAGNGTFEGGTAPDYTEWNITKGSDIKVEPSEILKDELLWTGPWFVTDKLSSYSVSPLPPSSNNFNGFFYGNIYFGNTFLKTNKKYKIAFYYKGDTTSTLKIGTNSFTLLESPEFNLLEIESVYDEAEILTDTESNSYLAEIQFKLEPTASIKNISIKEIDSSSAYEGQFSPKFYLDESEPSSDLIFKGNTAVTVEENTDYEITAYVYFKSSIVNANAETTGIYLKPDTYDFEDLKSVQVANGTKLIEFIEGGLIRKTEARDNGFWYKINTRFNSGSNTSLAIGLYLKGSFSDFKENFEFNIDKLEVVKGLAVQQDFIADESSESITLLASIPSAEINTSVSQAAGASQVQKSVIIPENVETGDLIILDLNGQGTVSYKVTDSALSVVTAGITDAINAATADMTITIGQEASPSEIQSAIITPVDVREGAKYILSKSPKNLFVDGDRGTFEDNGGEMGLPSSWNITKGGAFVNYLGYVNNGTAKRGTYSCISSFGGNIDVGPYLVWASNTPVNLKKNTKYKISAFLTHTGYDPRLNDNAVFYFLPTGFQKNQVERIHPRIVNTQTTGLREIYTLFDTGAMEKCTFEFFIEMQYALEGTGGSWYMDEIRLEEYSEKAITVEYITPTGTASNVVTGLRNAIKENSAALEISLEQYADETTKHIYHITPSEVLPGQKFILMINEKESIEFAPNDMVVSLVTAGLTNLINSKTSGEWSNVLAEDETTHIVLSSKSTNMPFSIKQIGGEWSDVIAQSSTGSEIVLLGLENNMPFTITQLGGKWKTVSASDESAYVEVTADENDAPFSITAQLVKGGANKITVDNIAESINMVIPDDVYSSLRIRKVATLDDIVAIGGLTNTIDGNVTIETTSATVSSPQITRIYITSVQLGNIFTLKMNGDSSITYIPEDESISNTIQGLLTAINNATGVWESLSASTGNGYVELTYSEPDIAFLIEQVKASETPEVKTLDKMASLHTVTAELGFDDAKAMLILEELISQGYDSALSIAEVPPAQFVKELYKIVGDFNAAKLYQLAAIRRDLTQTLVQGFAGSERAAAGLNTNAKAQLHNTIGQSCHCDDCETMVSPLAYLTDLTNYVLKNLKAGNTAVNLNTLESYFYQNFIELPGSCDDVKNTVCQVRIAVEVLRRYIHAKSPNLSPSQRQKLDQDLRNYMMKAYQYLLEAVGTSYSEIRVARSESAKRALAAKLGFNYDNNPDFLDKLYIEAQLIPMESWEDYKKVYPNEAHSLLDVMNDALNELSSAIDFSGFKAIETSTLAETLRTLSDNEFITSLTSLIKVTASETWSALMNAYNNDTNKLTKEEEELWAKFNSDLCNKFSIHFKQAFEIIEAEWQKGSEEDGFYSFSTSVTENFLRSLDGTGTKGNFWLAFAGALKAKIEDFYFNERDLEEIFGMVDTSKDIFSDGAKINDTINCLSRWNLQGIEWGRNTDKEGYIYLEMDEVNATIVLYKDKMKNEEDKVGVALLDSETNKFLITEFNDSGLTGELIASAIDASVEIKISAIPLYLGWRLQGLREQWQLQDEATETPVIDPDFIDPADIEYPYDIALSSGSASKPIDFWHFRKLELEAEYDAYKEAKETNDTYASWGATGTEEGEFNAPSGIAVDPDGTIFISDTENNRIQSREPEEGIFSGVIDSSLDEPKGLFLHTDGKLYISDAANSRIYIADKNGTGVQTIGSSGTELGEFNQPDGLVVDKDNNLYVADSANGRIQRFGLPLAFTKYIQNYEFSIETITEGTGGNKKVMRLTPVKVKAGDVVKLKLNNSSTNDSFTCFITDASIEKITEKLTSEFNLRTAAPWNSVTAINHGAYIEITANTINQDFGLIDDKAVEFSTNLFFAAKDNSYYYTDKENNRVLKLDQAGNIVRSFGTAHRLTKDLVAFYRFDEGISGIPSLTNVITQTGDGSTAQKSSLTPANIAKGVKFKVTIGGVLSEITASDSTLATVLEDLTDEINEAANGVTAVNMDTYVEITKDTSGTVTIETETADVLRNTAASSVTNAHTNGTPVWSSDGAVSGSLQLNGTTDYVSIASSLQLDNSNFDHKTIELWFKASNKGAAGYQMLYRQGDSGKGLNAYMYNNVLYVGKHDDSLTKAYIAYNRIQNNTWHHLAIVVDKTPLPDSNNFRVYVDGTLAGSANVGTTLPATSSGVTLGALGGSTTVHTGDTVSTAFFTGSIDQLRIWNRTLDETEIQNIAVKQDSGDGFLNTPGTITIDKAGNVYVADTGNSRIQKFDGGGNFLLKIGEYGSDNGRLKTITGIAADNAGSLYITDADNAALLKFNDLGFLKAVSGSDVQNLLSPQAIAVNENGQVYVSDTGNDNIKVFDFDLNFLHQYTQFEDSENFDAPKGIAVDANENILIINSGNNKLVKLKKEGIPDGVINGGLWDFTNGQHLSVNADNYVCLGANAIFRFRFPEAFSEITLPLGSSLTPTSFTPADVKVDSFGNLLISDSFNHRIIKVKPNGTYINDIGELGTEEGEFNTPKGLAIDGAGSVYVCDSNNDRIQKFDSSLEFVAQWTNDDFTSPVFDSPAAIAIDVNGKAIVSNNTSDTLVQFDTLQGIGAAFKRATGKSLEDLYAVERKEKEGNSIEEDLAALYLDTKAYRHLLSLLKLAGSNITLFDSQPEELYNILTNAYKLSQYAVWKEEEISKGITLSQDYFVLRDRVQESAITFTTWRATSKQRKDWRNTLSSRIDQEAGLWEAHAEMLKEAEDALLQDLRDAFIMASDFSGMSLAEKAADGSKKLSIDLANNCCMRTTRVSQAFEGLQGIMWAVRNGLIQDTYPTLTIGSVKFDDEWKWMGSYATWRAAQFVFMYPENILLPSYAKKTQAFNEAIIKLRDDVSLSPATALNYANEYIDYINDVNSLTLIGSNMQGIKVGDGYKTVIYMIGESSSKRLYWAAFDITANQFHIEWRKVPGLEDVIYEQAIGFQPYYDSRGGKNIFLFIKLNEENKVKIAHIPLDIITVQWGELEKNDVDGEFGRILTDSKIYINNHDFFDLPIMFSVPAYLKGAPEEFGNRNLFQVSFTDDFKLAYDWDFNKQFKASIPVGYINWSPIAIRHSHTYTYYEGNSTPRSGVVYGAGYEGTLLYRDIVLPPIGSTNPNATIWNPEHKIIGTLSKSGITPIYFFAYANKQVYYLPFYSDDRLNIKYIGQWTALFAENTEIKNIRFAHNWNNNTFTALYEKGAELFARNITITQNVNPLENELNLVSNPLKLDLDINGIGYYSPAKPPANLRSQNLNIFNQNQNGLNIGRQLVKEYQYLLPMQVALSLQKKGYYQEALDWFRLVYNYTQSARTRRSMYYGLYLERTIGGTLIEEFDDSNDLVDWVKSPGLSIVNNPVNDYSNPSPKVGLFKVNIPSTASFVIQYDSESGIDWSNPSFAMDIMEPASSTNTNGTLVWLVPRKGGNYSDCYAVYTATTKPGLKGQWQTLNFSKDYSRTFATKKEEIKYIEVYIGYYQPDRLNQLFYVDAIRTGTLPLQYKPDNWLNDPLDPHAIAENRKDAYTKFTVMSVAQCMLDYADSEFTLDTAESVPRARRLYEAAIQLLESEGMSSYADECRTAADSALNDISFSEEWNDVWLSVKNDVYLIESKEKQKALLDDLLFIYEEDGTEAFKLKAMRNTVNIALQNPNAYMDIRLNLIQNNSDLSSVYSSVLADPKVKEYIDEQSQKIGELYLEAVQTVTGIKPEVLLSDTAFADGTVMSQLRDTSNAISNDIVSLEQITGSLDDIDASFLGSMDPSVENGDFSLQQFLLKDLKKTLANYTDYNIDYKPSLNFSFCIPPNPVITALRFRAELNLFKIRNCRNIAGTIREIEPFAAPTDAVTGLPQIGAAGNLQLPGTTVFRPTIYRYPVLIERAKQLVQIAQQIEASMLSTLEKLDAEKYSMLKAKQDLGLSKAQITLQDLRVREAQSGVDLAELQRDRSELQSSGLEEMIAAGLNTYESLTIDSYNTIASLTQQLNILRTVIQSAQMMSEAVGSGGGVTSVASVAAAVAAAMPGIIALASEASVNNQIARQTANSQIFSVLASFERRKQEWEFQRDLANQDIKIGNQQVKIAEEHVAVVGQERQIAVMQSDNAQATIDFLNNKFTNAELYDWMSGVLGGVYRFFLQQATAMARTASNQLGFERQELPPDYIKADYWQAPSDNLSVSGMGPDGQKTVDRKGLTGAERLLQDIYQLDQYAFTTDRRKLELTKTISLASMAPAEFQRFKETGELVFETSGEVFDRDFPGQYLRLIKRVRTSVVALVPPNQGIKATLANRGISYTVLQGNVFQKVPIARDPEMVALTGTSNATGLFELTQIGNDKLFPFENTGVETTWTFQMPKASNFFDYSTIADVLVTIEYTALHSDVYKAQVIEELSTDFSADRAFSFKNQFADQWYDLNNADLFEGDDKMKVSFTVSKGDFPANVNDIRMSNLAMYFVKADNLEDNDIDTINSIQVNSLSFSPKPVSPKSGTSSYSSSAAATAKGGLISTRSDVSTNWSAITGAKTIEGTWTLALDPAAAALFKEEKIVDILFVINYKGEAPQWPR